MSAALLAPVTRATPPASAAAASELQRGGAMYALVAIEWLTPQSAADSDTAAASAGGALALPKSARENALCSATLASIALPSSACPTAWIGAFHAPIPSNAFDWRDQDLQLLAFSGFSSDTPADSARIPLVAVIDPVDASWHSSTLGPESGARCQYALFLFPMPITDCDADGIPDSLAIETGLVVDCDLNGVPDTCALLGDLDGDGLVRASDLGILLANFGTIGPIGDLDCDGSVTASDLAMLLAQWS